MNEAQKKAFTLLEEVVGQFDADAIAYCAAEKTVWEAVLHGCFFEDGSQICLMVPAESFDVVNDALSKLCEGRERVVAPYASAQGKRALRYVASDSTAFDVNDLDCAAPGIALFISEVTATDEGWTCLLSSGKNAKLSFDPFARPLMGLFEGFPVKLPSKPQLYCKELLGAAWKKRCRFTSRAQSLSCIVNATLPYQEFLEAAQKEGVDLQALMASQRDYVAWRDTDLKQASAASKAQVTLFDTLAQRFRICEELLPHKATLLAAWEEDRKDNVVKAMADYLARLKKFYGLGLTIYFDEELFDLAVKALEYQGFAQAHELPGLVPAHHKETQVSELIAPYILNAE